MFKNWDWVFGKSPAFQIVRSRQLPGGKVEISLDLEKGHIVDCKFSGDFFFAGSIDALTERLKGCKYDRANIYSVLSERMEGETFYQISVEELLAVIF
jgi:lipoate-protein ligase A